MEHHIYTDGACSCNGLPNALAGWGFVVAKKDSETIIHKESGKLREGMQTNNRAEMEAMLQALLYCYENRQDTFTIYSDSEVTVSGINGDADRKANKDIWTEIEYVCRYLIGKVNVVHMKNDKKNTDIIKYKLNNISDGLAKKAVKNLLTAKANSNLNEIIGGYVI